MINIKQPSLLSVAYLQLGDLGDGPPPLEFWGNLGDGPPLWFSFWAPPYLEFCHVKFSFPPPAPPPAPPPPPPPLVIFWSEIDGPPFRNRTIFLAMLIFSSYLHPPLVSSFWREIGPPLLEILNTPLPTITLEIPPGSFVISQSDRQDNITV